MVGGEKQLKKKCISSQEYVELRQNADPARKTLVSHRVCMIDNGLYMIFDYYEDVDGQPVTCII